MMMKTQGRNTAVGQDRNCQLCPLQLLFLSYPIQYLCDWDDKINESGRYIPLVQKNEFQSSELNPPPPPKKAQTYLINVTQAAGIK
jgi:hypothetical protein